MELVWKCDFCSTVSKVKSAVIDHEGYCSFNPVNKHCNTCDHRTPGNYTTTCDYCKIHDSPHFWEVGDREKKCSDWKNDNLRTKKLKNIMSKCIIKE